MSKIYRYVLKFPPIRFVRNRSRYWILPGFEGLSVYDVSKFFSQQIINGSINERAAAISFNFVLAIPPTLIFIFTLIPILPFAKPMINELFKFIHDLIPNPKDYAGIEKFLKSILKTQRNGLLSIGFIAAFYFASNAMMGIMQSFDKEYLGFKKRNYFQKRATAFQLTFILLILIFATLLLLMTQGSIPKWLGIKSAGLLWFIKTFRWIVILGLFFYSIGFIYKHAPAVHKKWKIITPGSIVATFLSILFTIAFSYWVTNFGNYNKLYGSLGTLMFLMVLIFLNSLVLLIGFELNVSIKSLKQKDA